MAAAPELGFRNSSGQTQLVWPGTQLGFRVEASVGGLKSPVWQPIQEAASRIDGEYRLTVPRDSGMAFYRLAQVTEIGGDTPGDFADSNGDGIDGDFSRAVFLAPPPFGNDRNSGTMQFPVATLEHAVELAETVPLKHDVYIAQGEYGLRAPLRLPPHVSLFGQFDGTTNWGIAARNVTTISGPATTLILGEYPGEVLLGLPVRLVGLTVIAADATEPGGSSKAVVIKGLKYSVSLERCQIYAGKGAAPGGSSYGL